MPEAASPAFKLSEVTGIPPWLVESARAGVARLEDIDGTTLAILREEKLAVLNDIVHWATELLLVEARLRKPVADRSPADFAEQPWLQVFGDDDLSTFVGELGEALLAAGRQGSSADLNELVNDWRITAEALADDDRRDVLLGQQEQSDFVEVARPS